MPIVFVSPECCKIKELAEIIYVFDYVFTSEDPACQNLCDDIQDEISSIHMYTSSFLNIENCSKENFNSVMNYFSLKTGSVLIIAEKRYFNTLIPGFMKDEWQTLSFEEKLLM